MRPDDLLSLASHLAQSSNRPRQVYLRRAISSCYYALFHELCTLCADALVGGGVQQKKNEWQHAYRALNHGQAKDRFKKIQSDTTYFNLPKSIGDFGQKFIDFQLLRHKADYDPHFKINKNELLTHIEKATEALGLLRQVNNATEKRALAAYILFDRRP